MSKIDDEIDGIVALINDAEITRNPYSFMEARRRLLNDLPPMIKNLEDEWHKSETILTKIPIVS